MGNNKNEIQDINTIEVFDISKISEEEAAAQYIDYMTMETIDKN